MGQAFVGIMSSHVFRDGDGKPALAEDDRRGIGIQWLYVHTYHPEQITNTNECFFADYKFVDATCVPKHPLITDLKQARMLKKNWGHKRCSIPYCQPGSLRQSGITTADGEINIQDDEEGNTVLHYAIMYSIASKELTSCKARGQHVV